MVLISVVVVILTAFAELEESVAPRYTVVAGLVSLGVNSSLRRRKLDCESDRQLGSSYSTKFFLHIATSKAAALAGFVAFILSASPIPYAIGFAFAVLGFASFAPTRSRLVTEQRRLRDDDCSLSLTTALAAHALRPKNQD